MPLKYKYNNKISWMTSYPISIQEINREFGSEQAFKDWIISETTPFVSQKITEAFMSEGIPIVVLDWKYNYVYLHPMGDLRTLEINIDCSFESDEILATNPITAIMIVAIGLAIALVVAAITVPPVFFDWLKAMTTSTITTETLEWGQNPITGEWGWQKKTTSTYTDPNVGGIAGLGAILIVIVIVGLIFFMGLPKRRR